MVPEPDNTTVSSGRKRVSPKCACGRTATFGPRGTKIPIVCGNDNCFVEGYRNIAGRATCVKCGDRAYYGPPGGRRIHCRDCQDKADKIKYKPVCRDPECPTIPIFGPPGADKPIACKAHKTDIEVDVHHKKCEFCDRRPTFGNPLSGQAKHCLLHKGSNEVDVANIFCAFCNTRASYGHPIYRILTHCVRHKTDVEINLTAKKCGNPACPTEACYGDPKTGEIKYCTKHKNPGDVNLVSKMCIVDDCNRQPSQGFEDDKVPTHCDKHKIPGQFNIKSKRCHCNVIAGYGNPGDRKRVHCAKHKLDGEVDLGNKPCMSPGCNRSAYYGYLFEAKTHCWKHRLPNQFIKRHPRCYFPRCSEKPTHSDSEYPHSCEEHALPGEANIVERNCSECGSLHLIPSNRSKCDYCYIPDTGNNILKANTTRKLKEKRVKELLEHHGINYESWDKIIPNSCGSSFRPDFVIHTPFYKIVVEVDENQHRTYTDNCEYPRMVQLMLDSGFQQLLIIRYNPDAYYDVNGVKSPVLLKHRERTLIETIKKYMTPVEPLRDVGVSIIYLYYDDFNGTPEINKILCKEL